MYQEYIKKQKGIVPYKLYSNEGQKQHKVIKRHMKSWNNKFQDEK